MKITNLDKSRNELERADLVERHDLNKLNHMKANRTSRHSKPMPIWRSRWVEGHQCRDNKGVVKGLKSR